MNDRPRPIGSEPTAPAAHLALPMYRQTLEGDDLFHSLPDGVHLTGKPQDYLRLSVQNDDTVAFVPMLFAGTIGTAQIEELACRTFFALGTQNDNNWAAISYQAFCTAIVQEAVTRTQDQERLSAINQQRAKSEKTASNSVRMLERVLSGLRGDSPAVSTAPAQLPQPEYRHQISPLITSASNLAATLERYMQEMLNLKLIDSTEQNYFYPTEKLALELSSFYRPLLQES